MEGWPLAPAFKFPGVPTDAERFEFLERFRLHVSFHADHVTLMWQKRVAHWEAAPPYYSVASGKTLTEATDAAIARYREKRGLSTHEPLGLVILEVRGSVS